MANEYAVNSADLTSVANAIREKGGTENPLSFPAGFVSAIQAISGGGASLGLIAVPSADSLPETANANTIAVITEQTIGSLYVQGTVPETAVDGDVLILTVRPEKSINLSESGALEIGVDGAYIRNNGTWSFVDTYIFVDGAWSFLWSDQLYWQNNQYTDITGGWISVGKKSTSDTQAAAYAPTIETEYEGTKIRASIGGTATRGGIFYLPNPIDLTPYKTLVFKGAFQCSGLAKRNLTAAVWSSIGTYYESNRLATYQVEAEKEVSLIELDVSGVDKAAYIGFGITGTVSSYAWGGVTSVTLESAYLIPKEL